MKTHLPAQSFVSSISGTPYHRLGRASLPKAMGHPKRLPAINISRARLPCPEQPPLMYGGMRVSSAVHVHCSGERNIRDCQTGVERGRFTSYPSRCGPICRHCPSFKLLWLYHCMHTADQHIRAESVTQPCRKFLLLLILASKVHVWTDYLGCDGSQLRASQSLEVLHLLNITSQLLWLPRASDSRPVTLSPASRS